MYALVASSAMIGRHLRSDPRPRGPPLSFPSVSIRIPNDCCRKGNGAGGAFVFRLLKSAAELLELAAFQPHLRCPELADDLLGGVNLPLHLEILPCPCVRFGLP